MAGESRNVVVRLSASVAGYIAGMGKAEAATSGLEASLGRVQKKTLSTDQVMSKVGKGGRDLFLATAGGIAYAEKKAADFNAEMATVQTLAHANARQFDLLSTAAKSVGVNIGYSATDTAKAEEELIKAGVSVKNILGGGLKGALDLAAAGQTDVATATEVAASAMTQFSLKGKDVPHIADLLAAGADKALGSVTDLGYGLAQVGTTAHQMGFSIEATTGTLAQFAQSGLLGEKGGATLKQMLLRLANPTKAAQGYMEQYGLSLYKANGQIKTMPELAGNLQRSFEKLTPAQRNAALGTIFGSRAIQGANILIREGEAGNRKWIKSVNDQGFAAHQASGKMNSLSGDLKKLKAQLDNALIGGAGKQGFLRVLTQDATNAIKKFNELSTAQKNLVGKGLLGGAAVGGALWTASKIYSLAKGTASLYRGIGGIFSSKAASGTVGALSKASGVTPVEVMNWPPGFGVPGKPGPTTPLPTRPGGGAGAALSTVGEGAFAGWGLSKLGKAPADLSKVWQSFQEKSALQSLLGDGTKLLGRLGGIASLVTVGDAGNEVRKPGKGIDQLSNRTLTQGISDAKSRGDLTTEKAFTAELKSRAQAQALANASLKAAAGIINTVNPSMGKYAKTLSTIPKEIRSYVSTPGADLSVASMRRLTAEYKLTPKQVRTIMELHGFSETQTRIVLAGKAYQALPKAVKTAISTPGVIKSAADVKTLAATYHLTPKEIRTVFQVSGVQTVKQAAAEARAELAAIPHTVYVDIYGRNHVQHGPAASGATKPAADGWSVPKTGRGYADRHPALLADGEEVISNRFGQADRHRGLLKAINANRMAGGGTAGKPTSYNAGAGVTVYFPAPSVLSKAVSAADAIAAAGVKYAATAQDVRNVHLDDLHMQQQIEQTQQSLAAHNTKTVGKGKHAHKVNTGYTLTGLDRNVAAAELADEKAQLAAMRKWNAVATAAAQARNDAIAALKQTRADETTTLQGTSSVFASSPAQFLGNVNRQIRDLDAYGSSITALKAKGASPALLALIKGEADSGDLAGAAKLGKALLAKPALLGQLNASLGVRDSLAGAVATATTDPRFSSAAAWNPSGQVPKLVQVQLMADPSTWIAEAARVITHQLTTQLAG